MGGPEMAGAAGELIDDRYRLEEAMSGGVTATTWRAHDPILGRDVAVKLWSDASADAHRSQRDELGAARLLDPNLNELLDAGSHDGRPYLVREIAVEHPVLLASPPSAAVPAPDTDPSLPAVGPSEAEAAPRRKDRVVMISAVLVVMAVGLVAVGLVSRPQSPGTSPTEKEAQRVVPAAVASFDPEGDGNENADELGHLLDGDPATSWSSDRYKSRLFGNLKSGLGLVLEFTEPTSVEELEVLSDEGGWSAEVYGAEGLAADLAGWGGPVARATDAGASEKFDLRGRTVGAVLIWFTDIGPRSTRLTIADVRVIGSP